MKDEPRKLTFDQFCEQHIPEVGQLSRQQLQILEALFHGKKVVINYPMRYGKTFFFNILKKIKTGDS